MTTMLSAAARSMHGDLYGKDRPYTGVSTDTRTLAAGELFFALSGPNFDGQDFVKQADTVGAAAAVVAEPVDTGIAQIKVDNTRRALGDLARAWRESHDATVVGVTGSNGKTTLKELIAVCLATTAPTLATQGNLNNEIGVPLMLLRIDDTHRFAVLELGANHIGEIAYLTSLARPNVVVITNAGQAHLEGFGSIEGVARGKGEILQGDLRPDFAVLNADDAFFEYWSGLAADIEILSFGLQPAANVFGDRIEVDKGITRFTLHVGSHAATVSLPLAGSHNVRNACAAAAVATALGISFEQIVTALESVTPVSGRLRPLPTRSNATLYDDSYNANPLSVIAAAEFLASLPGRSWFVLGDMKELGADEARLHSEVGETLKRVGIDRLFATGDLCRHTAVAFGNDAKWFESADELAVAVSDELAADVNVLVKGSRSMRMERVVDAIREPDAGGAGG